MSIFPMYPMGAIAAEAIGSAAITTANAAAEAGSTFIDALLGAGGDNDAKASTVLDKVEALRGDKEIEFDQLGEEAFAELQSFRKLLLSKMSEAGIDTSLRFHLESDGQGGVRVAGDHPRKEAIDRLFDENPELRIAFTYLDGTIGLMKAQQDHAALKEAISNDTLLGTKNSLREFQEIEANRFRLMVNGPELEVHFGDQAYSLGPAEVEA